MRVNVLKNSRDPPDRATGPPEQINSIEEDESHEKRLRHQQHEPADG